MYRLVVILSVVLSVSSCAILNPPNLTGSWFGAADTDTGELVFTVSLSVTDNRGHLGGSGTTTGTAGTRVVSISGSRSKSDVTITLTDNAGGVTMINGTLENSSGIEGIWSDEADGAGVITLARTEQN
ncbi:MAG: hypothetical protein JSV66_13195 [Trueperaceae bacterium]|nr:MAG: hypothetical protein JSV66_13195 [Trueperaceae bacterium]